MSREPDARYVFSPPPRAAVQVAGRSEKFPVRRVYCVGQNYAAHTIEMGASTRKPPFFFSKPADAVTSAREIPYPPLTRDLHHEVELVVALGQGGRNLSTEQAAACVFGYAVGVDLTRRDLQAEAKKLGRPWTVAKGFDHSAPVSHIAPAARCAHPERAAIRLEVNGELRQLARTDEMIWPVAAVISELSRYVALAPGDLLFTGTPAGVAPLVPGDRVEASIEGVARLEFAIR